MRTQEIGVNLENKENLEIAYSSCLEKHAWREMSKKLYSCVLHLNSIANFSALAVIGPSFQKEITKCLSDYSKLLELEINKNDK